MSIEIVTGFQGVEHIEPAQVGRLLASLVGTECYVVGEGDPLSATVRTANQVRIGAGEIIMQGRHITCESYTDLTIESGTTGYKRNDLVVCRYERSSSTGVESATLKVVKGTATAGTPSDPAYVSGSIIDNDLIVEMPLWRIPITNLTPGAPVKLFTALPYGTLDNILDRLATAEADIEDTRDSISQGLRHIQGAFTFEQTAAGSVSTKTITFSPAFDDIPLADACFAGEFNKAFAQCYVSVASITETQMVLRMVNGTTGQVTAPVRYQAWLGV